MITSIKTLLLLNYYTTMNNFFLYITNAIAHQKIVAQQSIIKYSV